MLCSDDEPPSMGRPAAGPLQGLPMTTTSPSPVNSAKQGACRTPQRLVHPSARLLRAARREASGASAVVRRLPYRDHPAGTETLPLTFLKISAIPDAQGRLVTPSSSAAGPRTPDDWSFKSGLLRRVVTECLITPVPGTKYSKLTWRDVSTRPSQVNSTEFHTAGGPLQHSADTREHKTVTPAT